MTYLLGLFRAIRFVWFGLFVLVNSVMAVSSYFAYTTVGFDFETLSTKGVNVHYYRLRWDEGSFWIGTAIQPKPRPNRPLDWFDPGGTLFDNLTRPVHRSRWNDLGFWRVTTPQDDPYVAMRYGGAWSSVWWACPSWLVLISLWSRPVWKRGRWFSILMERRSHHGEAVAKAPTDDPDDNGSGCLACLRVHSLAIPSN